MARGLGINKRGFANSAVTKITSNSVTDLGGSISFYAPFDSDVNDDSDNNHTVTAYSSAAITTSVKKFGAGSLSLNGSSQYLSVAGSTDFSFGTGDFTIEFWVYPLPNSGTGSGFDNILSAGATDNFWQVGYSNDSANIRIRRQGGQDDNLDLQTGGDTVTLNVWKHVAICRDGTEIKIFLNGSKQTLLGNPSTYSFIGEIHADNLFNSESSSIEIGRNYGSTNSAHYFKGYIDDLRIIKGYALYTSSFVAPTSPVGTTADITNTIVENKFLSSVWSLKDQNKKISKGEWIRNDANSGSDAKGVTIIGANLETTGHRWYVAPVIDDGYQPFFDPSNIISSKTLSNSNKTITHTGGTELGANYVLNSVTSKKYYIELTFDSSNDASLTVGVVNSSHTGEMRAVNDSDCFGSRFDSGDINDGDTIGLALDADNKNFDVYVNNTKINSMSGSFSVTGALFFAVELWDGNALTLVDIDSYTYTAPSGYVTGWVE